ncbi:MAG: DeoR/GlpR transcriptional regulator [Ruminiclostridium sp.]|nr:DeoR/GlpR transcriptional regulator [Ruminiclostridium sp.]
MHKAQRQKDLIDLLSINNVMSISDLSQRLKSSMMTIRRDLEYLDKKGLVKKMHGGALMVKQEPGQPSFFERIEEFDEEKARIGKAAAAMIKNGSIVFFDAGTTPLAIIEHIPDDIEFTAITTGLMTAVALCGKPKASIINIGGNIHQSSYSATNYLAIEYIKRFNADIAFISTKAISIPSGTFEAQLPLIEVKKAIVSVSNEIILLADHSKFEAKSLCHSIPLEDIDTIITDSKVSPEIVDMLRNKDKKVILV